MMHTSAVARRYARALFEVALQRGVADQTAEHLRTLASVIASEPTVRKFVRSPSIAPETKHEILHKAFSDAISPLVLSLLDLLVERRRLGALEAIAACYQQELDQWHGITRAKAISAVELDEQQRQRLCERLEKMTGRKIILQTEVRPEIIGGLIVEVGAWQLDGSVVRILRELRDHMKHVRVHQA